MPKGSLKFAPLAALGLLGYLIYTAVDAGEISLSQNKGQPTVTKAMLHPELVTPQSHASPVGRDPFEVSWSSYRHDPRLGTITAPAPIVKGSPTVTTSGGGGQATLTTTGKPSGSPTEIPLELPPLPAQLTSVMTGDQGRLAIIDGQMYREGDLVRGSEAAAPSWRVEAVEPDRVRLKFGDVQKTLYIAPRGIPGREEKKSDGAR
jgi:hypothetical protein